MTREEAIKCIKDAQPFGAAFTEALETLVPELKESEDERIRKNIIAVLYDAFDKKDISDKEYKEMFAWLEKQDAQTIKEALRTEYEKGRADAIAEFEKQVAQRSVEWSEEDEIGLDEALWCCKQAASVAKDENDMGNAWLAEKWLKSLKQQPTQEWSETDENVVQVLKDIIEKSEIIDSRIYTNSVKEKLYHWLKSLKPQNRWKLNEPTDETTESETKSIIEGHVIGTANATTHDASECYMNVICFCKIEEDSDYTPEVGDDIEITIKRKLKKQ